MLLAIAAILVILWLVGAIAFEITHGLLHLLLLVAGIMAIVHLVGWFSRDK